jgi:hypothetical protein
VPSISLCEIFRKSTGSDDLWLQRISGAYCTVLYGI